MRNIIIMTLATLVSVGVAAGFILHSDRVASFVEGLLGSGPAEVQPTTQRPAAEPKQRIMVYTRPLPEDHILEMGRDVTFQLMPEASAPSEALDSEQATQDVTPYTFVHRKRLTAAVDAGDAVLPSQLGEHVPEAPEAPMSDASERAAVGYIDRVRALFSQPGTVFLSADDFDPASFGPKLRFEQSRVAQGGRLIEGVYVGGSLEIVETAGAGGVSSRKTLAENVQLHRVSFENANCGEARHYAHVAPGVVDRIALLRVSGETDRLRLRLAGEPVDADKATVCSNDRCRVSPVDDASAGGAAEPTDAPSANGPGANAPDTNTPDTNAPDAGAPGSPSPARGDTAGTDSPNRPAGGGFALGNEGAPRDAAATAEPAFCRNGTLVDPRTRE